MDDRELDLSQREADLAIRMRAPVQADLIQRKLFTVHYHMYASKEYLAAASARPTRWKTSATTPSSSMARPRRRKSATSTGCWSCYQQAFPRRLQRQRHPHQQHHRHPAGGGSGLGHRRGARLSSRPSIPIWCRCCPTCRRPSFDVHLVYADALAPIQARGGVPRFPGQGLQGLAVLSFPACFRRRS